MGQIALFIDNRRLKNPLTATILRELTQLLAAQQSEPVWFVVGSKRDNSSIEDQIESRAMSRNRSAKLARWWIFGKDHSALNWSSKRKLDIPEEMTLSQLGGRVVLV
jgi:hypothetical protein